MVSLKTFLATVIVVLVTTASANQTQTPTDGPQTEPYEQQQIQQHWLNDWWKNVYELRIKEQTYEDIVNETEKNCVEKVERYKQKVDENPTSEYYKYKLESWEEKCQQAVDSTILTQDNIITVNSVGYNMSTYYGTTPEGTTQKSHLLSKQQNTSFDYKEKVTNELIALGVPFRVAEVAVLDLKDIMYECYHKKMKAKFAAVVMIDRVREVYTSKDGQWHYLDSWHLGKLVVK